MTGSPVLKRLLDTGLQYSEMSQKNAEKLVADFVKAGQVRRKDAEKTVQRLVERGRTTSEHIVGVIQSELAKQLGNFAQRLDDIEARVEDVAGGFGIGSFSKSPSTVVREAATAVRPAPAEKAAAKKSPAKKAATKKSPAKQAAAKKSPAKKAAGPSGVAKVAARKAPAKKAAAKK